MNLLPIFIYDKLYIPHQKETVEIIDEIKLHFTYSNPQYYKKKNMGYWVNEDDKYVCNYEFTTYKNSNMLAIPRGGITKIREVLSNYDLKLQFIDERVSHNSIDGWINNVALREDQERLFDAMKNEENCLIRSGCGSGKGEVGLKFVEYSLSTVGNVLVIVWQSELFEEWINRASYRFQVPKDHIGQIKGVKKKIKPITIAMQQTLKNCIDKYKNEFGCVICDEVQRFGAKTFNDTINKIPAYYRIGLSEDETRSDKMDFYIYDAFGEVAEEIKKCELVDKGAIHEIIIRVIPTDYNYYINGIQYKDVEDVKDKRFPEMLNDMCEDRERNTLIWEFMEPVLKAEFPSVVMSHRVKQVLEFDKIINSHGYKCGKVLGGEYRHESSRTIKLLKEGKIQVGVGSIPIRLGQAVDVPRWSRGFLLTPIKGKQQFNQVAGRLSRPFEGKTEAILYVFWDRNLYPYYLNNLKKWSRNVSVFDHDSGKWKTIKDYWKRV
jgi:superfamily II DNA or RNA helicase